MKMNKKVNVDDDTRYNIHKNECYATTMHASVVSREEKKEVFSKKKFFCILMIAVAVILLIIAVFISIVFAFIEISNLKNTSFGQSNQELAKLNSKCEANGRMLNVSMLKLKQLSKDHSMLENRTQELINDLENPGLHPSYPAASCAAILQFISSSLSGHYWIRSSNGSAVHAYCDMTRSCGNITGGWTRVVELDMSNTFQRCPSSWTMTTSPARSCFASMPRNCTGTFFPAPGLTYNHICGRAIGYSTGSSDAFAEIFNFRNSPSIDEPYVDGISVTHGSPRQHIWTFGVGHGINHYIQYRCPCDSPNHALDAAPFPPSYVGSNYFCDGNYNGALWDAMNCTTNCCTFNNPPWFSVSLPAPTSDNIEVRICGDENPGNENTLLSVLQLYVQ